MLGVDTAATTMVEVIPAAGAAVDPDFIDRLALGALVADMVADTVADTVAGSQVGSVAMVADMVAAVGTITTTGINQNVHVQSQQLKRRLAIFFASRPFQKTTFNFVR
jgi:hypothetical protein